MNIWNAEIRLISIPSNDRSIRVSCQQVSRRLQTNYTKHLKQTSFKPCTQQLSQISACRRFQKRRISSRFCPFRNWRRSRDFCRTKRAALLCQDEAWCRELGPLSFSLLESAKNKRKNSKLVLLFQEATFHPRKCSKLAEHDHCCRQSQTNARPDLLVKTPAQQLVYLFFRINYILF